MAITTKDDIDQLFTFTTLSQEQAERIGLIREAGREFANVILSEVPDGQTKENAIAHILETVMLANVAIAHGVKAT